MVYNKKGFPLEFKRFIRDMFDKVESYQIKFNILCDTSLEYINSDKIDFSLDVFKYYGTIKSPEKINFQNKDKKMMMETLIDRTINRFKKRLEIEERLYDKSYDDLTAEEKKDYDIMMYHCKTTSKPFVYQKYKSMIYGFFILVGGFLIGKSF